MFMAILMVGSITLASMATNARAADEENCLMCHKHRGNGRIDIKGKRRIFYVNEEYFSRTTHGRVPCRGCHTSISQIPHKVQIRKVNCGTQCHKKEPSTGEDFSHRAVYINYKRSVHSTNLENPEPGKPVCKYCHSNPMYTRDSNRGAQRQKPIERILDRCNGCHVDREWAETFYMHVEHRLMKRTMRSRYQVVQLCSSCHEKKREMLKLKGLSKNAVRAAVTYKRTYHWRAQLLGRTDTADCLDCHTYFDKYSPHNVHLVLRPSDPDSPVHIDNKGKVCRQSGCHDESKPGGVRAPYSYADLDMHPDFDDPTGSARHNGLAEFALGEGYFFFVFMNFVPLVLWMFLELLRRLV
ncbi:MAG: hypothetical protein ACE5GM_04570 [bacterium]